MLTMTLFIKNKSQKGYIIQQWMQESLFSDVENSRADLFITINEWKKITNPNLTVLGEEVYDNWEINEFNVLDTVLASGIDRSGQTQFLDRVITERRRSLSYTDPKASPDKANNVFELDLTNFLDTNNANGLLDSLTLNYGTSSNNRPDIYVLMGRIRKDASFELDDTFEEELSSKSLGTALWNYGVSWNTIDSFSFEYKKIDGGSGSCTIQDRDIDIEWCNAVSIRDYLTNSTFDLDRYFYRLFLVFGTEAGDNNGVPFKISSPNGSFWVGNLDYGDLTILTPNNSKRRFIIESSSKNSSLPYLVYSLWVKGEVQLGEGE